MPQIVYSALSREVEQTGKRQTATVQRRLTNYSHDTLVIKLWTIVNDDTILAEKRCRNAGIKGVNWKNWKFT